MDFYDDGTKTESDRVTLIQCIDELGYEVEQYQQRQLRLADKLAPILEPDGPGPSVREGGPETKDESIAPALDLIRNFTAQMRSTNNRLDYVMGRVQL